LSVKVQRLEHVDDAAFGRMSSGLKELDQVLGGGLVPGSVVLLAGEPGIGKSTLALQVSANLAAAGKTVLYVSAEESPGQVKLRAQRLGVPAAELLMLAENNLELLLQGLVETSAELVVVDSIQAVYDPALESAPATLSQVRQSAGRLAQFAKHSQVTVLLIGHVTKEGAIAGPKALEHLVDVVLYFEGERTSSYRMLRGIKNRFGSTEELGLFEMTEAGMKEVASPSALFLSDRRAEVSGSVVTCALEGTRPLLVEIQALTATCWAGSPRRLMTGIDYGRGSLMVAVLEKRVGMNLADQDIYVNVAGGLRVVEPASDLAVLLALASSYRNVPARPEVVAVGEVGLGGEVRPVPRLGKRLAEAKKLGFSIMLAPAGSITPELKRAYSGIELVGVDSAEKALEVALS